MAGERRWGSFLNVSASGPEDGGPDRHGAFYPKTAAQLAYTTNDAKYYSEFWQRPERYFFREFTNHDLFNAQYRDIERAISRTSTWFGERASEDPAFDGGSIHFTFSGHGREDGVLLLNESTFFAPSDLVELAIRARESANIEPQTKLIVYLDSCYSGKFLLDLYEIVSRDCPRDLGIFWSTASSFPDELSWEVPELGHGIATFCASVRGGESLRSLTTRAGLEAVLTWKAFNGIGGCSLVTSGRQNPIEIENHGEVTVCNRTFKLYDDECNPKSRSAWEEGLELARAEFRRGVELVYNQRIFDWVGEDLENHIGQIMNFGNAYYIPDEARAALGFPPEF